MEQISHPRIAILMATYNGARYVAEQIESILHQTCTDWTLYIHDDGSTDDTRIIITRYADAHDNIVVMSHEGGHGAMENFLGMLRTVEAEYYLFCDQDDVWKPEKVEREMAEMRKAETETPEMPIIIHSDLSVVGSSLQPVHPSFLRYSRLRPDCIHTFSHAVEPFITGCTMLFNRAARDAVQYPATHAIMHDIWVALCTLSKGGRIILIDEPLVRYRQHGHNALGARDIHHVTLAYRMKRMRHIIDDKKHYYAMLRTLGYGSWLKYLKNKLRMMYMVRKRRTSQS